MTPLPLIAAAQHLRHAVAESATDDRTLLSAFAQHQDADAFSVIVNRYGPMVMGVCRRTVGNEHDAEDAFQATFLALVRKPDSIRRGESLAGWLYATAHRICLRAIRDAARRRRREGQADLSKTLNPVGELTWREVREALDEEVARLPVIYRSAFVLCHLDGLSHAEAASRLGVKIGTVSCRASRACQRLRERLSRRGIDLSVVLAAVAVSATGQATVSTVLTDATVRLGVGYLTGGEAGLSGSSAKILTLAEGAFPTMFSTTTKVTTALVLALSLVGAGASLLPRPIVAAQPPTTPGASPATQPEQPANAQDESREGTITGQVLSPNGDPVSGASVWVVSSLTSDTPGKPRSTTEADGRFRVEVSNEEVLGGELIATVPGFGPTWIRIKNAPEPVTLRLPEAGPSIVGRILDLEGKPIPNVSIRIHRLGRARDGDLQGWIDENVASFPERRYLSVEELEVTRIPGLPLGEAITTDDEGRFQLDGLGQDQTVRLLITSPMIEHTSAWAVTRPGPRNGWLQGTAALYPAEFDHPVAPCKPIVGTVRDRKTGQALVGITIMDGAHTLARTQTDEEGNYRLEGVGKASVYFLSAGGGPGIPYFDRSKHGIPDTPGLKPITVDFDLDRGIEITGTLTDAISGKPVAGRVSYYEVPSNPYLQRLSRGDEPTLIVSNWGNAGPDGKFTVLGMPGPGALVASAADENGYVLADAERELARIGSLSRPAGGVHAVVAIDEPGGEAKYHIVDIALTPGEEISGGVVEPEGKPALGVRVAGLTIDGPIQPLVDSKFSARGLGPNSKRALVFLDEENNLGTVFTLQSDTPEPVVVKLQRLGSLTGRLLDSEGNPLSGYTVIVYLDLNGQGFENLPQEVRSFQGVFGISAGAWKDFTDRTTTTDAEGRFQLDDLLPGERYHFVAGDAKIGEGGTETHALPKLRVEAGETRDLGDLKPNLPE